MGEEGFIEDRIDADDGTIFIRRRHGDKCIYLGMSTGHAVEPDVLVRLDTDDQDALRVAVRALQPKGVHRWP